MCQHSVNWDYKEKSIILTVHLQHYWQATYVQLEVTFSVLPSVA